jgi:hypothetical protein
VPIGGKQRRPIDGCVTAIAQFCDCKVWLARDLVVPSYVFFGFDVFAGHQPASNKAWRHAWRDG